MKKKIRFILNDREVTTDLSPVITTLDFLRSDQRLKGTKEGCKEGECGTCTVLLGEIDNGRSIYIPVASCMLPLGEIDGKHLVTIEGISNGDKLNPVQQAIVDEGATQCGFCTPGLVMSFIGFFLCSEKLAVNEALDTLDGNICRCTGYASIKRVAEKMSALFSKRLDSKEGRIKQLVQWQILPDYFLTIAQRLETLFSVQGAVKTESVTINGNEVLIAGATDLFVQYPDELYQKKTKFLSAFNFNRIEEKDGFIYIGAGITVRDLRRSDLISKYFPALGDDLLLISSAIIRSRATIGGNLANASPIGDLAIIFLAFDTWVILTGESQTREVRLRDFFKNYKELDLRNGEVISGLKVLVAKEKVYFSFEKVSQRKYLDIASCNTAISFSLDTENRIVNPFVSAGGVAPIPLYLNKTAEVLDGKNISPESIRKAAAAALDEISPISDIRGTTAYKKLLLRQLMMAHFIKLFPEKRLDEVLL